LDLKRKWQEGGTLHNEQFHTSHIILLGRLSEGEFRYIKTCSENKGNERCVQNFDWESSRDNWWVLDRKSVSNWLMAVDAVMNLRFF
jgi:hypothetical protein